VVIGDSSSLDFVSKIPNGNPDLSLRVGMSAIDISEELTSFIKKYKTQGSFEELSSATPVPDTKVETKVEADTDSAPKSDTADIMAKIDAQLQAMEKVGATTTNNVETVERQPELPGRHRVLVIDDATIVHKTIKAYLNPEYEVATAISGKVALRFLMAKDVSLILLDYEMPEMDGPAVLTKIRENPELADIPVVFLTGINDVDKIKSALALKPQGYLLKPVDAKALMNKMHEIVK
jgi:CheY-like chemotaxis protein